MKAFSYDYSLESKTVWSDSAPVPVCKDGLVLLDVIHAGLNPLEYKLPSIPIMKSGRDKTAVGHDVVGKIVEIGKGVKGFEVGDLVFGIAMGSVAEKAVARPEHLAKLPQDDLDLCGFAGLAIAGVTALQALKTGKVFEASKPVRVLVIGASGGVGHLAVQLAKSCNPKGTSVIAVSSGKNAAFVKSLGADEFYDYNSPGFDISAVVHDCDAVIDCIAPEHDYEATARACLKLNGLYITLDGSNTKRLARRLLQKIIPCCSVEEFGYRLILVDVNSKDLEQVRDLLIEHKIAVEVRNKVAFSSEGMVKAFDDLKTHHVVGKLVVAIKDCDTVGCNRKAKGSVKLAASNTGTSSSSIVKGDIPTSSVVKSSAVGSVASPASASSTKKASSSVLGTSGTLPASLHEEEPVVSGTAQSAVLPAASLTINDSPKATESVKPTVSMKRADSIKPAESPRSSIKPTEPAPEVTEAVADPVPVARSRSFLAATQDGLTKASKEFDTAAVDPSKVSVALKKTVSSIKVPSSPPTPEPVVEAPPKRSSTYLQVVAESIAKDSEIAQVATESVVMTSLAASSTASVKRGSSGKVAETAATDSTVRRSGTVKVEAASAPFSPVNRSGTVKIADTAAADGSASPSASVKRSSSKL